MTQHGTNELMYPNSDLDSGKFSDLRIQCQGVEWKVHRFLVCTVSKFFDKACEVGVSAATVAVSRVCFIVQSRPHGITLAVCPTLRDFQFPYIKYLC